MTESEYTNEQLIDFMYDVMDWRDVVDHPMIYAVIEALKERHAYRAIGTVEELNALKQWKSDIIESFSKYDVNSVDELMKRFKELAEKAEPKKPNKIERKRDEYGFIYQLGECPLCGKMVTDDRQCCDCGQRLDFGEEK